MARFNQNMGFTKKELAGLMGIFALATASAVGIAVLREPENPQDWFPVTASGMKADYDQRVVPALRDIALSMCGNVDAETHGLLAAKFIYDTNADDDVRGKLKAKHVDPQHGAVESKDGDGYLPLEKATKLADYLIKNNVITMAEPDIHEGKIQAEYIYNGIGGGFLTFYYKANPLDSEKESIDVPQSPAVVELLEKLMDGKLTEFGKYMVTRNDQGQWHLAVEPLVMDGPAAPARLRPQNFPKPPSN